jgi:glyoxylase-like metal-dependent hydrolase (beta-lactamase superfamily II)
MFTRIALLLIVIVAVPYYWLLMDTGPGSVAPRMVDIARLRALADGQAGPRPLAIEYTAVATDTQPGTLLVASGGLRSVEAAVFVWHLAAPGGDTVINSGLTRDQAMASGFGAYHKGAQATVDRWLGTARRIIFTSEEIDHVGGLVAQMARNPALGAKVIGNPDQVHAIRQLAPAITGMLKPAPEVLSGPDAYGAIAPGIAVMRAPGHLPGGQMIYVHLQDGREYLFLGDIAPMRRNVEWQRPRSRYAAEWQGSEDRAATLAWIKGLAVVKSREPALTLVFGHDHDWLRDHADKLGIAAAPPTAVPPGGQRGAR